MDSQDNQAGGTRSRINPKSPREALAPEPAPAPPRSRRARNPFVVILNSLITLAMILMIAAGGVLYWGKQQFDAPGPLKAPTTVTIAPSSGLGQIATLLESTGVIDDALIFQAGVRAYQLAPKLKAGEYAFPAKISMHQAMDLIASGKSIMHQVTIPEGLTSMQIVEKLKADPVLVGDPGPMPAEGTLLPETYSFTRGTTRQQIIEQMKEASTRAIAAVWEKRKADLPLKSPLELVTLASIVEKETGKASERPHVAAIFVNRLNKGMRLQSDPTIIYGLVQGKGTLGRPILRSEIDSDTPYNTYKINGLPPGPIANPGRAALEAAANPMDSKDLYFVADGTGGHLFASSLDEHNRNVVNWRAIERQRAANGQAQPDQREPDAIDATESGSATGDTAGGATDGTLDLLDGMPPRDPNLPILPVPKPAP